MSERSAGVLLHPTSFPGRFGIGDLGPPADRFLAWAQAAGQRWWQILPLGPPARGQSPYTAYSAFAGNPLLISPDLLRRRGLLTDEDLSDAPDFPADRVDFNRVAPWKERLLRRSWRHVRQLANATLDDALREFSQAPEQATWLDDWALFAALHAHHGGRSWWRWPGDLAARDTSALIAARRELAEEIAYQRYVQFLFASQWRQLADAAHRRGLRILGDLPIYVALDSADAWAHRELFDLDDAGRPRAVAGVPPDYFSDDGQLWGNPLYRWDRMADDGFSWWVERLAANLRWCDALRLDHFRGFEAYWRVPADAETAAAGDWAPGPGKALFDALEKALGPLPLIAEDLGDITPEVESLRRELGLPGMKILQFAFNSDDSEHLPHHHEPATVVYTGTHDNQTSAGWAEHLDPDSARRLRLHTGAEGEPGDIAWSLIRTAYLSPAETAIVPIQDVLGLGNEARMNVPAVAEGHWTWRLDGDQLTAEHAARLRALAEASGRLPASAT